MTAPTNNAAFYADFKSLAALKHEAKTDSQKALRGAAQQFESLFITMMLKSMRQATSTVGDSIGGGNEMDLYQGMYDQQVATQLSSGKGLGLADLLVQQLNRSGMVKNTSPAGHAADTGGAASNAPVNNIKPVNYDLSITGKSASKSNGQSSDKGTDKSIDKSAEKNGSREMSIKTGNGISPTAIKPVSNTKHTASRKMTPAEFVEKMWPHAQKAAQQLGVDPTTLIAHAALETGWGKHVPCHDDGSSSHNLFGIKAGSKWNGQSIGTSTVEFSDGVAVKRVERFKAYDSPEACFADYAALLATHPRYGQSLNAGSNTAKFAQALQKGGYATDPDYATKLKAVARSVMSLVSSITGNAATQLARTSQAHGTRADT